MSESPRPAPHGARRTEVLGRYARFLVVGTSGVVVNLTVFILILDALGPGVTLNVGSLLDRVSRTTSSNLVLDLLASGAAFVIATLWNFTWNNLWTFRDPAMHRRPLAQRVGLYYGVSAGSLAVNEAALLWASFLLPPIFAQLLGIALASIVGFLGNQWVTFAPGGPGGADLERSSKGSIPADADQY